MTKRRKHWYRIWYTECPLCGRSKTYRERKYTKRPKNMRNRVTFTQEHCGCQP
jgi:hypothetical protein